MRGCLIWDFDGTLGYRTDGMWTASVFQVLTDHMPDHRIAYETLQRYVKGNFPWNEPDTVREPEMPADEWWRRLEPVFVRAYADGAGLREPVAAELATRVRAEYVRLDRWSLFDDALPALNRLRKLGWRHVLLSNHVPELVAILRHLQVSEYFDSIYNSAITGVEKPNPQAFQRITRSLQHGTAVWMIGDNPVADVEGAEAVGIPAILVRSQNTEARRQCTDLTGVEAIVESRA